MSNSQARAQSPLAEQSEECLLIELRQRSHRAFAELVARYHNAMIRLARSYVSSTLAEEVAQETWIAVWKGLEQFEGRSSLKTWMFRILINRASTHAESESRHARFARAQSPEAESSEPLVDPFRFNPPEHPTLAGHWLVPPRGWTPEELLLSAEIGQTLGSAIENLPVLQRQVFVLRDVEGWSGPEVCELLDLSEANQRVLLHRARAKLRNVLEEFFTKET